MLRTAVTASGVLVLSASWPSPSRGAWLSSRPGTVSCSPSRAARYRGGEERSAESTDPATRSATGSRLARILHRLAGLTGATATVRSKMAHRTIPNASCATTSRRSFATPRRGRPSPSRFEVARSRGSGHRMVRGIRASTFRGRGSGRSSRARSSEATRAAWPARQRDRRCAASAAPKKTDAIDRVRGT